LFSFLQEYFDVFGCCLCFYTKFTNKTEMPRHNPTASISMVLNEDGVSELVNILRYSQQSANKNDTA